MPHKDARGLISSIENSFAGAIDTLLGLSTTVNSQKITTSSAVEVVTTSLSSPLSSSGIISTSQGSSASLASKSKSSKTSNPATQSTTTSGVFSDFSSGSVSTSETSSTTSSSSSSSSSSSVSSNSASISITTITASPVQSPSSTATPSSSDGNRISPGGIAIAVIFGVIIATVAAYVIIKCCPTVREKFARRQQRKQDDRTYRKGLDRDEEESMVQSPNSRTGLGLQNLRPFSFHTSATYWPGRPDTKAGDNGDVSPISDPRSLKNDGSLPRSLTAGPKSYLPYRPEEAALRASAIGMAVPMRSSSPADKGLPPVPVG